MNKELKRVSIVVLAMFCALFVSVSIVQVGAADTLNADPRNSRTLYDSYNVQRGAILVAGKPVAESVPSNDQYRYQRIYPQGPLYSAVTGFFPISGEPTGIEGAMNGELSGTSNDDFLQQLNNLVTGKHPQGNSIETTIDPVAQQAALDAMGSLQGAVVMIEPSTGKILAMVSTPNFDPNSLAVHDSAKVNATYKQLLDAPGDPLVNKAIIDVNPPGSSFKPVLTATAFDSGKYTPDSTFPNPAALQLPGSSHSVLNDTGAPCAGGGDTVSIAMAQIYSCNIPMAELAMQMGGAAVKAGADKFGFNHSFNVPMKSSVSNYTDHGSDKAQVALTGFGQGTTTATALQIAMNSATIANHGIVMDPTLIDSVITPSLEVKKPFQAKEFGRAISAQAAQTESDLMVRDVSEGIVTNARIDGVAVAGKTGTAQMGGGKPYTLWFTGFAPAQNPKYAIAVVVENGGGQGQNGDGNSVATPVARKVLEAVLNK